MKNKIIKSSLLYTLFILSFAISGNAQELKVTGDWLLIVPQDPSTIPPGEDLDDTYISDLDQGRISIKKIKTDWIITARFSPYNWHPDLSIGVKRTGDGQGPGSISGGMGSGFLYLTTIDQNFFNGYRNRNNVPIQLSLEGASVQIPTGQCSGAIIYTLIAQ